MRFQHLIVTIAITALLGSCKKEAVSAEETRQEAGAAIELTGLIKKLEATSFQYGTHSLSTEAKRYALKSNAVNLDQYINQTVTIKGSKVAGYPVDGGPEYIEVKEVK